MTTTSTYGDVAKPSWQVGQRAVFIAGLKKFRSDVKRLRIQPGLTLRERKVGDLSLSAKPGLFESLVGPRDEEEHVLEIQLRAREYEDTKFVARLAISRVLLALRLLKPGFVRVGAVVAFQPTVEGSRRRESWYGFDDMATSDAEVFQLTRKESFVFKAIHRNMGELLKDKSYTPFGRFEGSRERWSTEDRLLDYWIGLEFLFSHESESQELTYKYAIRIAHFLGRDRTSRLRLFDQMNQSYKARSKIVHGKKIKDISEIEEATGSVFRDILRTICLTSELPDLNELDRMAASGR